MHVYREAREPEGLVLDQVTRPLRSNITPILDSPKKYKKHNSDFEAVVLSPHMRYCRTESDIYDRKECPVHLHLPTPANVLIFVTHERNQITLVIIPRIYCMISATS